jgi:MYXO-CTERM domain-containing protein
MLNRTRSRALSFLLFCAALFAAALAPRPALAAGSASLSTKEPTEVDGRWKMSMTIDMGSMPDLPHVPFLLSFTATSLYERALLDKTGDKPQLNKIALANQQPTVLSMDVGFSDPTGKIFKTTKFDFQIRRDRGFEAGEYDLVVKRESDGVQIGQKIHLTLKGDNPIVDRRAIVFSGEKKEKKKDPPPSDGDGDKDKDAKKDNAAGDTDKKPEGDAKPAEGEGDGAAPPPPVPPKQGGCGCSVPGSEAPAWPAGVALAFVGLALARRRATPRHACR